MLVENCNWKKTRISRNRDSFFLLWGVVLGILVDDMSVCEFS